MNSSFKSISSTADPYLNGNHDAFRSPHTVNPSLKQTFFFPQHLLFQMIFIIHWIISQWWNYSSQKSENAPTHYDCCVILCSLCPMQRYPAKRTSRVWNLVYNRPSKPCALSSCATLGREKGHPTFFIRLPPVCQPRGAVSL